MPIKVLLEKRIFLTLSSFLLSLLTLGFIGFAWFTLSHKAMTGPLAGNVIELEGEYELFVFIDEARTGDVTHVLHENIYQEGSDDRYYLLALTKADVYLFDAQQYAYPGNVFSFAIRVKNLSETDAYVDLNFSKPRSLPAGTLSANKIQNAFYYQVSVVYYFDGVQQVMGLTPPGSFQFERKYFLEGGLPYNLVQSAKLMQMGPESCLVVYFNIAFDPLITVNGDGNVFQNQQFMLDSISISLRKAKF